MEGVDNASESEVSQIEGLRESSYAGWVHRFNIMSFDGLGQSDIRRLS